jgi:hypothetical protein
MHTTVWQTLYQNMHTGHVAKWACLWNRRVLFSFLRRKDCIAWLDVSIFRTYTCQSEGEWREVEPSLPLRRWSRMYLEPSQTSSCDTEGRVRSRCVILCCFSFTCNLKWHFVETRYIRIRTIAYSAIGTRHISDTWLFYISYDGNSFQLMLRLPLSCVHAWWNVYSCTEYLGRERFSPRVCIYIQNRSDRTQKSYLLRPWTTYQPWWLANHCAKGSTSRR